jgi:very-short-patch-repair endonuclease
VPRESANHPHIRGISRTRGAAAEAKADDGRIAALAGRQYGVVAKGQLLEMGFGRRAIEHRLERGRLHLLHGGVYSVGHRVVPRQGRWLAAVLASGSEAVLSHWSAAALWMIRPNSRSAIDVTVPHRSRSSRLIRRHVSHVPEDERLLEEGIPVTSVPRTIFDLAAAESVDVVVGMIKQSEHLELHDRLSLPHLLERYPGRRGARKIRIALKRIEKLPPGRPRSLLEERFVPFLRRHHLPLPRLNDWILLGEKRFQVDCHWPEVKEIVELDSWQAHGTRSAFRDDRARDRALRLAGYGITRFTYAQLDDEPHEIAADLQTLLKLKD